MGVAQIQVYLIFRHFKILQLNSSKNNFSTRITQFQSAKKRTVTQSLDNIATLSTKRLEVQDVIAKNHLLKTITQTDQTLPNHNSLQSSKLFLSNVGSILYSLGKG